MTLQIDSISPPSGLTDDEIRCFASPNEGGRFLNPWGVNPNPGASGVLKWKLGPKEFADEKRKPVSIPVASRAKEGFESLPRDARVQWLGHASVLIELDGLRIVIDPIFGRAGGLVRRLVEPPLRADDLPPVDVILISHGHHDHYDPKSVSALIERSQGRAICLLPMGISPPKQAKEHLGLTWWQRVNVRGVDLCFVPAQHWHARSLLDRNRALWGGWVIRGSRTLYHSGDTGYFAGFGAIGKSFGSMDLAILPLGAYEPRWFMGSQHMAPEDSVRAYQELRAKTFLGMHWGTFDLSDEPSAQGPEILRGLVAEQGLREESFLVVAHGGGVGFSGSSVVPFAALP